MGDKKKGRYVERAKDLEEVTKEWNFKVIEEVYWICKQRKMRWRGVESTESGKKETYVKVTVEGTENGNGRKCRNIERSTGRESKKENGITWRRITIGFFKDWNP